MPLPEGHWREKTSPRRPLGARERWLIGIALAVVIALVVGFAVSLGSSGTRSADGCIDVTVQAVTGGTQLHRCGTEARALCAEAGRPGQPATALNGALLRECRRAGLPTSS